MRKESKYPDFTEGEVVNLCAESQEKIMHSGAVCSYCGRTVTEDEYSCGRTNCHHTDVIAEEDYG